MKIQSLNSHLSPIINRAGVTLLLMLFLSVMSLALWGSLTQDNIGTFLTVLGFLLIIATFGFNVVRDVIRQIFGISYTASEKRVTIVSIGSNFIAGLLAVFIGGMIILMATT
ncbi:MAG: hypothetical protein K8L91_08935 [Anaerolineae bacterium]|nr:hypothetical protein [Anaerolineae bacterium]